MRDEENILRVFCGTEDVVGEINGTLIIVIFLHMFGYYVRIADGVWCSAGEPALMIC